MIDRFFSSKRYWLAVPVLAAALALPAQTLEFPTLDPLPPLDSLSDSSVYEQARLLANRAAQIQQVYQQQFETSTGAVMALEAQLAEAKADSNATTDFKKELEKALKTAKKAEKAAQKDAEKAEKTLEFTEKVSDMEAAAQRKNLPKAHKNTAALLPKPPPAEEVPIAEVLGSMGVTDTLPAAPPVETPPPAAAEETLPREAPAEETPAPKKAAVASAPRPAFKTYDPAADVLLHPPARGCRLSVDTRDEFSGERRREAVAEELFRFTAPALRPYLLDRDHVRCDAALSTGNGTWLLNLVFTINDVNARRAFGSLPRNGVAILKLLDGETFTLYNVRADEGQANDSNTTFTFRGQYPVDPGMFKKMQKSLLDKIRVAWSTGYEDYDIHNVDLLARQLNCLIK